MLQNLNHLNICSVCHKKFNRATRILVEKLKDKNKLVTTSSGVKKEAWICFQCGVEYVGLKIIQSKNIEDNVCFHCDQPITYPCYKMSGYNGSHLFTLSFHMSCYKESAPSEFMFEEVI